MTVTIDEFSLAALEDAATMGQTTVGVLLVRAIRYYLAESDKGRPGWPCSLSGPEEERVQGAAAVKLDVDGSTWQTFSLEADRQEVSADQLLRHAALYFLADQDSGHITQRILDDLESSES